MRHDGFSLIELAVVLGIAAASTAIAVPQVLATIDDSRALAAARYLSTRLQQTRTEAVLRTKNVALRVTQAGASYSYTVYQDGNGDGVLARDIQRGVDTVVHPAEALSSLFSGVDFGALPGLPAADSGGSAPGSDPVKLGSGNMVSFTATGTSSTGSLYILGRRGAQYALVVYGETGRTRLSKWDALNHQWRPL
ncbi:MAG TPA: GspH/FimT family pseudopilin [Vicinamibacterales bacterium]|jgi:prepilin-type N-terminal cleavage/methylation domain-containing protein|nr:GspH/FimT family pseudopilin [Vicinamibacterales bacterium]